jgi:hypothetical protein
MLTRDAILQRVTRRTTSYDSAVFGGVLRLQELSRLEWRLAAEQAAIPGDPGRVYTDWHDAAVCAYGIVDAGGAPLFTCDDILSWRNEPTLWDELRQIADVIRALSEVGADSLKSGDPAPDA